MNMRVLNVVMLHISVDNNFHVSLTTECFKYYTKQYDSRCTELRVKSVLNKA